MSVSLVCASNLILFSWGANSHGQLCNGNTDDILEPRIAETPYPSIKYITGGGGHTALITENGDLYTAGWNNKGQLGLGSDNVEILIVTHIPDVTKVKLVSCGWNHTLIICNNGQLYGCGSNEYGQIGLGDPIEKAKKPRLIPIPNAKVTVSVAAGLRHSLVITDCGQVWAFGANKSGQLGLQGNNRKSVHLPEEVTTLSGRKIVSVAAGSQHSVSLSESGEVFCWGSNQYGQCGMDPLNEGKSFSSPVQVGGLLKKVKVDEIFSGWYHILAKTDCGKVFSWGRSCYGQLGLGDDVVSQGFCYLPQEIPHVRNPKQIHCGSQHNVVLNCSGQAVCWGWNEHGICGTGDEKNVHEPTVIQSLAHRTVKLVSCGGGTTFAVVSSNNTSKLAK